MPSLHKPRRCLHQMLILNVLIFVSSATTLDQEPLPDLCESVKCPPDGEMECPADSSIRQNLHAVDLIKSNAVELPPTDDISSGDSLSISYNRSLISDEDYVQCCVNRKCVCKTCYIPDCDADSDNELVVVDLKPENSKQPGECCGTHECRTEPNCTVVRDTDYLWRKQCQRCKCVSGLKICHKDCEERSEGVCQSKNPERFYKDGETWSENCKTCECVKGEPKCTMAFCGVLSCPIERQYMLKDSCCPACWPKCAPMPHEKQDDESYGDYGEESETPETDASEAPEEEPLPALLPDPLTTQESAELIESSTTSTETPAAPLAANAFDQPKVVEVSSQINYNYFILAYSVVVSIVAVAMGFYIYVQRAKKRSYDPVSILDHSI
ncbi:uncharacterized protein LOC119553814 [Drosophila subpulchrella]|uniref:uncharacterized protein LOC119553814 n=1 Tax=Drosophila subpulchrella TaxID=1486046 RepID=UPI0018A151CC|nr:uncharacterized protein LOC119553814 [Drosophila subpulchrella]